MPQNTPYKGYSKVTKLENTEPNVEQAENALLVQMTMYESNIAQQSAEMKLKSQGGRASAGIPQELTNDFWRLLTAQLVFEVLDNRCHQNWIGDSFQISLFPCFSSSVEPVSLCVINAQGPIQLHCLLLLLLL